MCKINTPKETEFINKIKNNFCINEKFNDIFGIGDDCAVFSLNKKQVVTCDMLVENTHFDLNFINAYDLGKKAVLVNISDIAAMGASPKYAFISIGYNNQSSDFLYDLYKGMSHTFKDFGAYILGGDTVKSEKLVLNITLIGETDNPIMRNNAQIGDYIIVSNYLGLSHAGLDVYFKYGKDAEKIYPQLCNAHINPKVSCDLGIKLNPFVNSMMDLSDGISKDLVILCKASGVGAILYLENFEQNQDLIEFCQNENKNIYDYMLASFEEYCLLMTCEKKNSDNVCNIIKNMGFCPQIIGTITENKEIKVELNGNNYPMPKTWEHF